MMKIITESSIAAGIRRIEAVTGKGAEKFVYGLQNVIGELQTFFQNTPDLIKAVSKLIDEDTQLRQQLKQAQDVQRQHLVTRLQQQGVERDGVTFFQTKLNISGAMAKDIAFMLRTIMADKPFVFISGTTDEGKALLTLMLSDDVVERGNNAGQIVREAGKLIQGGGGGQPNFATAGGKNPDGLDAAIEKVLELLKL